MCIWPCPSCHGKSVVAPENHGFRFSLVFFYTSTGRSRLPVDMDAWFMSNSSLHAQLGVTRMAEDDWPEPVQHGDPEAGYLLTAINIIHQSQNERQA